MPTVQRSARDAFSEAVIQTLICSDNAEEQKQGVQKTLDLRKVDENELIDWSDDMYEPPLTWRLPTTDIKWFNDAPMQVPQWSCHAQAIEWRVKQVTDRQ